MINKGISAGITLAFLGLVRPDPTPTAVGWGIVAILMYETLVYCIGYIRKMHRSEKQRHYIAVNLQARKEEGERLDNMVFNPFKNVKSEVS